MDVCTQPQFYFSFNAKLVGFQCGKKLKFHGGFYEAMGNLYFKMAPGVNALYHLKTNDK